MTVVNVANAISVKVGWSCSECNKEPARNSRDSDSIQDQLPHSEDEILQKLMLANDELFGLEVTLGYYLRWLDS